MEKHLQLAHVSDLHFGDHLMSPSWPHARSGGLAVHDLNVAEALTSSLLTQRLLSAVSSRVVATGDLTTWGRVRAFSTALTFLRGKSTVGALKVVGLDDPEAAVVPGNHDIWSVVSLNVLGRLGLPLSSRKRFDKFFRPPVPTRHHGSYFPYCVRIPCGPVALYLYGLDSNRLEAAPRMLVRSFLASGFVPPQQLDDLELNFLPQELDEPRIRVAALHHPLAYKTVGTAPFGPAKKLINLPQVFQRLQKMNFAISLVGHEHTGFARQDSVSSSYRPLHVFSAGTATQMVRLTARERQLVNTELADLGANDRQEWEAALAKCNEYRLYVFEADPAGDFKQKDVPAGALTATIRPFKYIPRLSAFAETVSSASAPVRLGDYVIN